LKKCKMWSWKGDRLTAIGFKELGMNTVPLEIADVKMAFGHGLIDSYYITPAGSVSLQWYTKIRYMLDYPLSIVAGGLLINKKAFYHLSPRSRKLLKKAMALNAIQGLKMFSMLDKKSILFLKEAGIQFVKPTRDQIDYYQKASRAVAERCITMNMFSRELYNKLLRIRENHRAGK
jgi:TRAP-type transport system periplasmic protein